MKNLGKRILVVTGLLSFCLNGCTPLKKKFTRKKKKEHIEKFIPVLDPIDYPAPAQSSKERYAYHYSLWKIWSRDLLQTFDKKANEKNQRYLLGQIKFQMEEMRKWIILEKQQELDALIEEISRIEGLFNKPAPLRNGFSIKKKLELNAKKMRKGFKPAVISISLINS